MTEGNPRWNCGGGDLRADHQVGTVPCRGDQVGVELVRAEHPGHRRVVVLAELLVAGDETTQALLLVELAEPHLVQP